MHGGNRMGMGRLSDPHPGIGGMRADDAGTGYRQLDHPAVLRLPDLDADMVLQLSVQGDTLPHRHRGLHRSTQRDPPHNPGSVQASPDVMRGSRNGAAAAAVVHDPEQSS